MSSDELLASTSGGQAEWEACTNDRKLSDRHSIMSSPSAPRAVAAEEGEP